MIASGLIAGCGEVSVWLDLLEEIPVPSLQANLLSPVRSLSGADPARIALIGARMDYASNWPQRAAILDQTINAWKERGPELLARFVALGFRPGLEPQRPVLGGMHDLTALLLKAFEAPSAAPTRQAAITPTRP